MAEECGLIHTSVYLRAENADWGFSVPVLLSLLFHPCPQPCFALGLAWCFFLINLFIFLAM